METASNSHATPIKSPIGSCLSESLAIIVGGIGLVADGFDLCVINLVRGEIAALYPVAGGFKNSWQRSLVTASSIFGAMFGQFVLGFLADRLGRRRLLLVSGGLTFAGALGSACAFDFGPNHVGLWGSLVAWRFVMGIGIGGEYPLSAAHTAEHSRAETSGRRLAWVFVLFGFGPLLAATIVYVCQASGAPAELTWRVAFGSGAALSVLSVGLRYRFVRNAPKFEQMQRERQQQREQQRERQRERQLRPRQRRAGGTLLANEFLSEHLVEESNSAQANDGSIQSSQVAGGGGGAGGGGAGRATVAEALREVLSVVCQYRRPLLGTALCWFLYDIVDFGLGLYSEDVLKHLRVGHGDAGTTLAVLIVQLISLPGCVAAVVLVPRIGRRGTQLFGLCGMLLVYVSLAIILSLPSLKDAATERPALMVSLYALQLTFDYLGPGATTYIIPGELFPTSVRATCHGLSAALYHGLSGAMARGSSRLPD